MPVTKKITELAQVSAAAGDDVPIAQGGFLKRAKAGQAGGFAILDAMAALSSSAAYLDRGTANFDSANWDNLDKTGIYKIYGLGSGGSNQPPASFKYGHLIVLRLNGNAYTQLYIPEQTDNFIYYRQKWGDASTPAPWRKIAVQ